MAATSTQATITQATQPTATITPIVVMATITPVSQPVSTVN